MNKNILIDLAKEFNKTIMQSRDVSSIVFVHLAQQQGIDETTILEHADLFPDWDINWTGNKGAIMWDGDELYRSLHDIGIGQNAKPSATPSLWKRIGNPNDEYPEWSQPIGIEDAYKMGDKVTYNGKKWVVTQVGGDGIYNIWQPGVYGWAEVTD